ncbi:MAG TPA: response regulator [Thermoplasmata archaeon]|jgi:CheY-like chemotaxis protein|nr:response regulator [Thermoplasmata archaeon]
MKILVVEDEPTNLKLAHVVLASEGHIVHDADEGEKAWESIKREAPDILVTDLAMPKLDGLSLVRRVKADPTTRHIIVIAITAYPDRFTEEAAKAAGCDVYIVKPMDTRRLNQQLDQAVEKSKREAKDASRGSR